jgi:hypothetical protein
MDGVILISGDTPMPEPEKPVVVNIPLPPEVHRKLKLRAVRLGVNLRDLLAEILAAAAEQE